MRLAALVSDVGSHLDFGGFGYLMFARAFQEQGHELVWIASDRQLPVLQKAGFPALRFPGIDQLAHSKLDACQEDDILAELLRRLAIDVVLSDRRLVRVPRVTHEAGLPLVAVGTPGGAWGQGARAAGSVADDDRGFGPTRDAAASSWISAARFNVVFMPRNFYGEAAGGSVIAIGHSDRAEPAPAHGPDATCVTVTTGNGGNLAAMASIVAAIRKDVRVEVFHPATPTFVESDLFRRIAALANVTLRGWADLRTGINPSTFMINLGGIASIWRAFSDGMPQICCPGFRGDQEFNAAQVQAAGIGLAAPVNGEADWMNRPYDFMVENHDRFQAAMEACRGSYTDDLQSAVEKIAAAV